MLPAPDKSHVQPGENNTEDNLRPLDTIMPLLDELLGLEVAFEKVANQAMICLGKIGNKYRARYTVWVQVIEGFAQLPPNCSQIAAVLKADTSYNRPAPGTTASLGGAYPYLETDTMPELDLWANTTPDQLNRPIRWQANQAIDPHQNGQHYVDYTFRDGGLYVGWQDSPDELLRNAASLGLNSSEVEPDMPEYLRVLYHGRVSDERGYPLITPEEALACAYFCNYVQVFKRYQMREATPQDVQFAEQLKDRHISQARVAPLASGNELDKVLDESKRYHRHFFGDDLRVA